LPRAIGAEQRADLVAHQGLGFRTVVRTPPRLPEAQGRRGGRPAAVDDDVLAVARARQAAATRSPRSPGTSGSAGPRCTGHCNSSESTTTLLAEPVLL
jgi:hypothetical protein